MNASFSIMKSYAERLHLVREQMAGAIARSGRKAGDVKLVAVSKTYPAEIICEVAEAGQILFGENRVQEAAGKIPLCPKDLEWHLIGHLQKNKVRKSLPLFTLLHGVDSVELAREINRISQEEDRIQRILLEVNTSLEATKFGFPQEQLSCEFEKLLTLSHVEILGLMTLAPITLTSEMARPYFAKLRALRDGLENQFFVKLPELSMGMSGDFESAIEEGATLVRIGSAIFGNR